MKKLKGILSIVMVLALLCSSFAFATTAQAADTVKSSSGLEAKLQTKVEDGVILHALCWSYPSIEKNIPAIAAAGYSTVQVSPVQQPKDISTSTNVSGQWWKLYQPVSLSLAKDSWVGTAAQLKSLCDTAHKYNVKIICDVVTNHLGATSDKSLKDTPWVKLADEVKTYEPTLWNSTGSTKNNPYFHNPSGQASDSNANSVTQLVSSKCPDLNTGNTTVQNRVISLLKECIDAGADGFRFDAAKHIETPADSGISPNNYWTNVINGANTYASSKGKSLFYYGEVLNTAGGGRSISGYTNLNGGKYRITDNVTSNSIRNAVVGKNASGAVSAPYSLSGGATHAVTWAESHDTYLNTDDAGNTNSVSNENILKTWALVASRKDATPLFFARTNDMKMGQSATNTSYKSVAAAEVNKFHNNFVGQSEKAGSSGNFAYVARGNSGVVIVNVNGTSAQASVSGTGIKDGAYKDMITGADFTVSGGTVSGKIGSTGIAVVVQSTTTPVAFADQESKTFQGDTITVGLSLANATSGTYQLENYAPVTFTGSPKIRIGSDYNVGDTIKLTLTATDGSQTTSTVYEYKKAAAASSGVYIIFPASVASSSANKWKTPIFAYIYDEKTDNGLTVGGTVYKNAAWPGEQLEYDSKLDAYYLEVNGGECIAEKTTKVENGGVTGSSNPVKSNFNLATSPKANVILSDSTESAEGGKQYPLRGGKAITLAGKTHKLASLSASGWQVSTEVPGQSSTPVAATEVKKGNQEQPTTAKPTEAPVTETQKETTEPVPVTGDALYGDVNGDKNISVKDATAIQKHVAKLETIPAERQPLADVTGDNNISVKDATAIQKYVAKLDHNSKTGQKYGGGSVEPVTQAPQPVTQAPEPVTQAPEPETDPQPEETYTLYIKTNLTWISSQGCEPYVYDNASGESYLMAKDMEAYPEVFKAEVPKSVSDVSFYRALAEATPETGYNAVTGITVSPENNCIVLSEAGKEGTETILGADVQPYVAEEKPAEGVSVIYVENDVGWPAVYIHGWGKGIDGQVDMEKVSGNIWKYELPETIYGDTGDFFLFKGTPAGVWDDSKKTSDQRITDNNNFYKLSTGEWSKYNG